jgi:hypothetical protein
LTREIEILKRLFLEMQILSMLLITVLNLHIPSLGHSYECADTESSFEKDSDGWTSSSGLIKLEKGCLKLSRVAEENAEDFAFVHFIAPVNVNIY